ncbi:MAG: alpha/beta hydrolase [Thermoplasmata archaeon]
MVVDPGAKKLLELLKFPDFSEMSIEDLRTLMNQNPFIQKNEPIKAMRNLSFEHHGIKVACRLYEPDSKFDGLIVYLHGGGFVFGNIESFEDICRKAANVSGCKVLAVEYRLAPEHKFPAAIDDAYESYIWARNNCKLLGIDPDKIAIAGDSAGGNLTAATCLRARDSNVPVPKLQVMFYPVLGPDLFSEAMREYGDGYFLTKKQMYWFNKMYLSSEQDLFNVYMSPILAENLKNLPEAIIITAEHDPLRDQGEMYIARLYDVGVPVTGIRAKGMIHGFINFAAVIPAAGSIASMIWFLIGQKLRATL